MFDVLHPGIALIARFPPQDLCQREYDRLSRQPKNRNRTQPHRCRPKKKPPSRAAFTILHLLFQEETLLGFFVGDCKSPDEQEILRLGVIWVPPACPGMRLRPAETQWHPPTISDASERHGRHCRSARSTDRSRGRRSCPRGDARPRWLRLMGLLHSIHSEPRTGRDYTMGRGRYRPVHA